MYADQISVPLVVDKERVDIHDSERADVQLLADKHAVPQHIQGGEEGDRVVDLAAETERRNNAG